MHAVIKKCATAAGLLALVLTACTARKGTPVTPTTQYDLQTGVSHMVAQGLSANVALSGTVIVNGTSTSFTGSGTYSRGLGASATFNSLAAMSQTVTISGTVISAGQSAPYASSVTEYYAAGDSAFLGETSTNEYDVVSAPIEFPTVLTGSGILGTVSRYRDSTMSVPLGTAQLSYSTLTPVDPGSPMGVVLTTKLYDTQNTLTETDVTNYTLSSAGVLSFVSASAQNSSGTLTVTAQ